MTLALYGKSRKRKGGLLLAALLAVVVAVVGAVGTITSVLAHHNVYNATVSCDGSTWSASANYSGGNSQRLVVITDVKVNGTAYATAWSSGLTGSIIAFNLANGDFADNYPTGADYMWDGTDSNGFVIFSRNQTNGAFSGNSSDWAGTIKLYKKTSGSNPKWTLDSTWDDNPPYANPTNIGKPTANDCTGDATIHVKKVIDNYPGTYNGSFTADVVDVWEAPDFLNQQFYPTSKTVTVSADDTDGGYGDDDDFTVSEDTPSPSSDWDTYDWNAKGDQSCPAADDNQAWGQKSSSEDLENLDAGDEWTVCFKNVYKGKKVKIQVHKYLPKDNPPENAPWQNQGAADGTYEYTVYADSSNSKGPALPGSPNPFGDLVSSTQFAPQTVWVTETNTGGKAFYGWYLPETPSSGNPGCNQAPLDFTTGGGYSTSANLQIPASYFNKQSDNGVYHICAYNKASTGNLIIHKVNDGPHPGQQFTADVSGAGNDDISFSETNPSAAVPLAPGAYTVVEDALAAYDYDGWAVMTSPTAGCPGQLDGTGDASVQIAAGQDTHLCFYNEERGSLIIYKYNDGGDPADGFTADVSGAGNDDIGFSMTTPSSVVSLSAGSYTVTEDSKSGYKYLGWSIYGDNCATSPQHPDDDTAEISIVAGAVTRLCFNNEAVGTVVLIKNESVPSDGAQTWHFTSEVLGGPSLITAANPGPVVSTSSAQETFNNVPVGGYSISESEADRACIEGSSSDDWNTYAGSAVGSIPDPDELAGNTSFEVEPGKTTYIVFENQGCGTVLSSQNLIVHKYNDPAGNMSGATGLGGWKIKIEGTSGAAIGFTATQTTDGSGQTVFAGIPDGTYTVAEETKSGWEVIGSEWVGGATEYDEQRDDVIVKLDEDTYVDFYNRELVTIRVHKTEKLLGGDKQDGKGWHFTLKGCGVSESGTTDSSGEIVWTDLPVADGCSYKVEEEQESGWLLESPASGQATVSPGAGDDVTVKFVNREVYTCTGDDCRKVPTPTTPTSTPVTPTEEVKGEKTPGPTEAPPTPTKPAGSQATPIAPSAGSGLAGGGTAGNLVLILAGMIIVTGGLSLMAIGHRKRS